MVKKISLDSEPRITPRTFVRKIFRVMILAPKDLGNYSNELAELSLRKRSPLGSRGKRIIMHRDNTIFQGVSRHGYWAIETVKFLISGTSKREYVFIDIGAHAGLVSLQALNFKQSKMRAVLIEPVPSSQEAIEVNLSKLDFSILPFALGDRNGSVEFFVRDSNRGNSSIFEGSMRRGDYESISVEIRDSIHLYKDAKVLSSEKIILKCDCEGYAAHILARVGDTFWNQIERGTIEVWSNENILEEYVQKVVEKLSVFNFLAWDPKGLKVCDLDSLTQFWLSGTDEIREVSFAV